MSQVAYFNLPDVGEGLTEAEIVSWKVNVGDRVSVNQVIVEIETAKSLVELPCPFEGVVTELLAKEGDTVEVGKPIIAATVADGAVGAVATSSIPVISPEVAAAASEALADIRSEASEEKQPNLVGYGVASAHGTSRRAKRTINPVPVVAPMTSAIPVIPGAPATGLISVVTPENSVIAKPPIRKLAKDLGVDLNNVVATGLAGEVTREDVLGGAQQASVFRNLTTPEAPTEREERIPVKGVRKAIATAMVQSAFTAPHVSVFVDVDATRTMEFVKRLKNSPDFAGVKVSPLLILAKAIIWAVRRNPTVNSTWTDKEIIVHRYVNLGVAAATPRGLIVPNVKDAQEMSLLELAQSLEQLTLNARDGKTSPADMAGGTITVTNIGVFGMDTGTPILNPGEVGILALGTIKQKPWVVDGEVRPRFVTTLGASFDHRVVDGDVASRFLADVASVVEEPALLLD